MIAVGIIALISGLTCLSGFSVVEPNRTMVLFLFGTYLGSAKENGFNG
jgi:regulator of protease activity HflC (stomatin/prohibitin superfamily)